MSKVKVEISKGGWGDEIEQLLNTVKDVMDGLFQKSACKDVLVEYSENGPMLDLIYSPNNKNYKILLNVEGGCWNQFVFQFAHEYCHILIGTEKTYSYCVEGNYYFMWFEEALCELASLVTLLYVSSVWKEKFISDKGDYIPFFYKYFINRLSCVPKYNDFKTWLAANYKVLSRDYILEYQKNTKVDNSVRLRGLVVAHALLPCARHPKFWVLIGKLEELQPFLGSDKICILLQELSAVVGTDAALVDCLKNIQDIVTATCVSKSNVAPYQP